MLAACVMGETLGERFRRLRTARGLSQDALARVAGTTRQNVYEIEKDVNQGIRMDSLRLYAAALDVSEQYLATGVELPIDRMPSVDVVLRADPQLEEDDVRSVVEFVEARRALRMLRRQERSANTGT